MGDVRYASYYEQVSEAADPVAAIKALSDQGVIAALAAASLGGDPYLANVLATEALNRVGRSHAISEQVAEGVYALDPSGRVTFVNAPAESLLGWSRSDLLGTRAHDMIHSKRPDGTPYTDKECPVMRALESGTNVRVDEDWFQRRDGSFLPVSYTAAIIRREGEVVGVVVTFHDLTEWRRTEAALERRADFEAGLATVASRLVGAAEPDADAAIDASLRDIGRMSGAHRAYLFQLRDDEDVIDNTHEWCAPGVPPQIEHLQGIPADAVPWWMGKMRRGEFVHVANVATLPPDASAERELLESQGIRSIVSFPVTMNGRLAGFIGFDNVENAEAWTREDLRALSVTAALFGSALERWRAQAQLHDRVTQQAAVAELGRKALGGAVLQSLMDEVARVVGRTLDVPLAGVMEYLPEGNALRLRAGIGWRGGLVGHVTISAGPNTPGGHLRAGGDPVIVRDAKKDDRFGVCPHLHDHGVVSGVNVIIRSGGEPWGLLAAHSTRSRRFTDDDVNFLQAIANVVGAAVEHRRAQEDLRTNEARFERIVHDVPAGLMLLDPEGRVVFMNPAAEQVLGDQHERSLGDAITVRSLRAADGSALDPERPPFRDVIDSGTVMRGVEAQARREDGRAVFLTMNAAPLRDSHGRVSGALVTFTDTTELKRKQESLYELKTLHQEIVDNVPAGVLYLDTDGVITYENGYLLRTLGAPEGAGGAVGTRIFDLPTMADQEKFLQKLRVLLETGRPFHGYETRYQSLYGKETHLSVSGVPLHRTGADGERVVKGAILLVRDVTENRVAEESVRDLNRDLERRVAERTRELAAANEELEAFSFSVSHDIRAPLRGIEYFSQILAEDYSGLLDDEGRDVLARLRGESRRLTGLVNDLLEFSRASRTEVSRECVDLSRMARNLVHAYAADAADRDVHVHVEDDLQAHADPRLARVVLDNLLGNAWKFTAHEPHAEITFGQTPVDGRDAFFVRDNGAGFDMAHADKLFVPFKRLHAQTEFSGTGIGLATVARIVERHGGEVWAEGEPGRGATFYFTFPDGPPAREE